MTGVLRVALGEYDTGWHDPDISLARAGAVVRAGAEAGAGLVVLPEMCTTGFTMEASHAEPLDGASVRGLAALAAASRVHLLAGVALREGAAPARPVNAALLFDAAGAIQAMYRKQRMFAFAGEHETYAPGAEPAVAAVAGLRIALFICYDLRFPELFRSVARDVDVMVVIANWPASRRPHWDALLRARAIENQCFVVGVNRTGSAGGLVYDGGSVAIDPWGEPVPAADAGGVRCVDLATERVREVRNRYPFLADL